MKFSDITKKVARRAFVQDTLLSVFASGMALLLVRWISEPIPGFTVLLLKWALVALVGTCLGIFITGFHKAVRRYVTLTTLSKLLVGVAIKDLVLGVALLAGFVKLPSTTLSIIAVLVDFIITMLVLLYIRHTYSTLRREETEVRLGAGKKTALVKGTSEAAMKLADELQAGDEYDVVGFVTLDPKMDGILLGNRIVYVVTAQEDLEKLMWRLGGIDTLFFTNEVGGMDESSERADIQDIEPPKSEHSMSMVETVIKRGFDLVVSGIFLVILSPILLICAIAIKAEDGSPVLYKQERIGRGGKPFYIYKFRSMRTDAEKDGAMLAQGEEDDRLTRVGRFLRAHHLDELPQLINVFRGDMSFVGYRPERQVFIDKITERNPRYVYLFQIQPGVTSFATLYNGYTDTLEKMLVRLDLDLYYLRRRSLLFDFRIMFLTALNVIAGKKF